MNARAVLYDYLYPFPQRIMKNYDLPGVKLAVAMKGTINNAKDQDQGWNLEVAIPWASFADLTDTPVPRSGDRWIANMNRWDGTEPNRRLSQWSDSGMVKPDPHYPDRFGKLLFAECIRSWLIEVCRRFEPQMVGTSNFQARECPLLAQS